MADAVSFTAMADGTREDYELLEGFERDYHKGTADRLLRELKQSTQALLKQDLSTAFSTNARALT